MANWNEFKTTPYKAGPRMRWWLPPEADYDQVRYEIKMMKDAGFSGAELSADDAWDQDQWYDLVRVIMEEASRQDFEIDLMIVGSWTTAWDVVTDINDPRQGARMELDGEHTDGITREHPYSGPVPVSGEAVKDSANMNTVPALHAVTVAKYVDKEKHLLSLSSARELEIGRDVVKTGEGATDWTVTFTPEDEGEYVLFAWWQHPADMNTRGIPQLDYVGKYGTIQLMKALDDILLARVKDVSACLKSLFVDSIEWPTHLDMFVGFREAFTERYGYDITKYLPALYEKEWGGAFREARPDFSFDEKNTQLVNSYAEFLTTMHIENHIIPLQKFCEERGLTLRYQTAYGKNFELARTAGYVDYPDTETLYGKDFIDFYRAQTAAVNILDKKMYSMEASAEAPGRGNGDAYSGNYEQGFKKHMWHVQRAYAAGVNQVYFHGLRYRGQYYGPGNENGALPNTFWPGHRSWASVCGCANYWDERQPNWNEMKQLTGFMGRIHHILQQGRAKVDLAVYRNCYNDRLDCAGVEKIFDSVALEQAGYSYDFLSPNYLTDAEPAYEDRRLFPEGPAYKAIVFDNQRELPVAFADRLIELADKGFPIVFCGETPRDAALFHEECLCGRSGELLGKPSVSFCGSKENLPEHLKALGILPDACYAEQTKVLTCHRHTEETDYFYFYNYADADVYPELKDAARADFTVTLAAEGKAYILNPWSGGVSRAVPASQDEKGVTLALSLGVNDSLIVAVDRSGADDQDLPAADQVLLWDKAVPLTGWTVDVETWTEGKNAFDTRKEITRTAEMETPVPWTQLDGMDKTSGVGYYRTAFDWDGGDACLSAANIDDCYRLTVNGQSVPANLMDPTVDIGAYLKKGRNEIEIAVSSTLLNAALEFDQRHGIPVSRAEIEGIGQFRDYGLWGPVTLIPVKHK